MLLEKFGLQMYSVKDLCEKDFLSTIKDMGSYGYKYIEFAGYYDTSATEIKATLDQNGLQGLSAHVSIDMLENDLSQVIADAKTIGLSYIICPWAVIKSADDAREIAAKFNKFAAEITKAGMKFAYHNHSHEFAKDEGKYLQDILFDNVDKSIVKMELDLYWLAYADVNIMEYCKKNIDVLDLVHVKQINLANKTNVNVPDGDIDFPKVIAELQGLGVKYFIVEQEECVSSADAAKINATYLKSL